MRQSTGSIGANALIINSYLQGNAMNLTTLIETGIAKSLVTRKNVETWNNEHWDDVSLRTVGNQSVRVMGEVELHLLIANEPLVHTFCIVEDGVLPIILDPGVRFHRKA